MIDPFMLKEGDRIRTATDQFDHRGTVDTISDQLNYVRVQWRNVKRPDILSKSSPLWRHMELDT